MGFDFTAIIIILVVILASMILHELMHGVVAYWLGDDTAKLEGRLTLNPLAHIDPVTTVLVPVLLSIAHLPPFGAAKPVPFNPNRVRFGDYGAALVAVAGPLTNLLLAFISYTVLTFVPLNPLADQFVREAVMVNLSFFAFNILPIPPLDGSRVLYAFAPEPLRHGLEAVERYGIFVVFALVLVGGALFSSIIVAISDLAIRVFDAVLGR